MPKPTDDGKTYTFKIRDGVKFHDGSPLTAADVGDELESHRVSAARRAERRAGTFDMVDKIDGADPLDRRVPAQIRHHRVPAGARRSVRLHLREEDPRARPALVREERDGLRPVQVRRLRDRAVDHEATATRTITAPGQPYLDRFVGIFAPKAGDPRRRDPRPTAPRSSSAGCRLLRATSWSRSSATRSPCRKATGTAAASSPSTNKAKPFDDVRVRRALTLAIDRWGGAPALSKIADVHTVGSIVFPGSPLAPTKDGAARDRRVLARHREIARRGQAPAEGGRGRKT